MDQDNLRFQTFLKENGVYDLSKLIDQYKLDYLVGNGNHPTDKGIDKLDGMIKEIDNLNAFGVSDVQCFFNKTNSDIELRVTLVHK